MSRFRNPLLRRFTETFSGIRNFSRKGGSSARKASGERRRKSRRLVLDTLEERQLLSLTAADVGETLVTDNLGWAYSRPDSVDTLGAEDTVIPYGSYAYSDERVEGADGLYYPKYIVIPGTAVSQSDRSTAAARDDDFAMTWTQLDTIQQASLDENGKLEIDERTGFPIYEAILDPATGDVLNDSNVYAKYFTNEVQQLTLSQAVLNGTEATAYNPADHATVTLHYGGNEIQMLTISTATVPTNTLNPERNNGEVIADNEAVLQYGDAVTGQITLAFDVNGNGFIENREQTTILYNELDFDNPDLTQRPEYIIQQQLRLMGGSLSDVRVQAVTAREFLIHFGDASGGVVQPSIQVVPETTAFSSGFLPWATVAKYNEPITVTVNVYPGDVAKTATEIEKAFKEQTQSDHEMAPWYGSVTNSQFLASQSGVFPVSRYADATVSVRVVTEGVPEGHIGFELTFLGADQSKNVPEMEVVGMTLVDGTVLDKADLNSGTVAVSGDMQTPYTLVTVKETSDVFRVNSADPVDVLTLAPKPLNQYDAQVAMDADGDFVVAWTGESTVAGSFTDIYARQFSPVTLTAYAVDDEGKYVPFEDTVDGKPVSEPTRSQQITDHGRLLSSTDSTRLLNVEAEREEFLVNSTLTLVQNCPTIGMDDAGNFVIGWQTLAQDQSWFETMSIQRYDSEAKRTGGEMQIESDTANYIGYGTVSMSRDGRIAIAWQTVNPYVIPAPGDDGDLSVTNLKFTYLRMMNPDGTWVTDATGAVLTEALLADGGASIHTCTYGRVAMAWDSNATLTVALAWCERIPNSDPDAHDAISTSLGNGDTNVYFWQYDSSFSNTNAGLTHVNTASGEQGWGTVAIGGWQTGASIGVDADGDLFISFEGRGQDVSGSVSFDGATYFADQIAALRAAGGITNLTIADYLENLNTTALDADLMIRDLSVMVYDLVTDGILSMADRQAEMILRAMGDSEWAQIRDDRVTELMGLIAGPGRDPTLGTRPSLDVYPYYYFQTETQPTGDMLWDQDTLEAYRVDVYARLVEGTWVDENGELVHMTPAEANEALAMYDKDGYPLAADPLVMVIWARVDAVHYADANANLILKRYGDVYENERELLWADREAFIEWLITIAYNQEFGRWRNEHVVNNMGLYRPDGAAVTVDGDGAPYYDFWHPVDNPEGGVLWSQNRLNAYRQEVYWKLYSGTFEGMYDDGTVADFGTLAYDPWACRAALGDIDEEGNWTGDADPRVLVEFARLEGNFYAFSNEDQIREIASAAVMAEQTLLIDFEAQRVADQWLRETYGVADIADPLVAQASAIMESKLSSLRGEAYGANFSTWDASVNANGANTFTVTSSDNAANTRRDGNNATAYIGIPLDAGQGSFYLVVAGDQILIEPVFLPTDPPVLDPAATFVAISDTLAEYGVSVSWVTGTTPETFYVNTYWEFSEIWSSIRLLAGENDDGEVVVQPWEIRNAIYEITFNGTYHDVSGLVYCTQNADDPLLTASDPEQDRLPDSHQLYTADPGRPQTGVSLVSDAEGNIVVTWTETNGPTARVYSESMEHQVVTGGAYYYDNHDTHTGYIDRSVDVYMDPYSGTYVGEDGMYSSFTIGYTRPVEFSNDSRIWFRRFNEMNSNDEPNDTAGPTVTDVTYGVSVASDESNDSVSMWTSLDAGVGGATMEENETFIRELNGTWLFDNEDGSTREETVTVLVISFDEELATSGKGSVLDPANWTLMKDGTNCNKAIEEIYFGLNKSSELAYRFESATGLNNLSRTGANRWEAVMILNGADSPDLDYAYLKAGVYELTAKASITDVSGNRLNRSGYLPNGQAWTHSFQVIGWNGEQAVETLTNASATLEERSTTPTASNANGDYAVVYRSLTEEGVSTGIELDLYNRIAWGNQEEDEDLAPDRQPLTQTGGVEIYGEVDYTHLHLKVTDNETACNASVAMDGDGDFIVVWTQNDSVTNVKSDWNIYAKKYDFQGRVIREAFRVNQTIAYDQQYPSVAVDAEGSFVVVWQSNNQDGSGWGIYMQRYTPNCVQIGGENASQTLTFDTDNFSAGEQFRLQYGTRSDSPRTVAITMIDLDEADRTKKQEFCDEVRTALEELLFDEKEEIYLDVDVTMDSSGALVITFQGLCGCQTVKKLVPLTVSGSREYDITVTQSKSGSPSERQVNATTDGDQIHPAVDMNENGEIVVSWTSYGMGSSNHQYADGTPRSMDTMSESDICARRFISNETYLASLEAAYTTAADATPLVVTSDDYNLHIAYSGAGSDGVVKIMNNALGGYGTGALLWDGMHILTAAHVVTAADEMTAANPNDLYVYFDMPDGTVTVQVTEVYIPDEYQQVGFNQAYGGGHDIAVLTLATAAPTDAERYDIYRDSDEIGQDFTFYGYGQYGLGAVGEIASDQYKRYGENTFESLGTEHLDLAQDLLVFDFDDGTQAHNAPVEDGMML